MGESKQKWGAKEGYEPKNFKTPIGIKPFPPEDNSIARISNSSGEGIKCQTPGLNTMRWELGLELIIEEHGQGLRADNVHVL